LTWAKGPGKTKEQHIDSGPQTARHPKVNMEPPKMSRTDKRKQSLYFPEDMLREIQIEANRQDRSLSWIVQQAWRLARAEIMRFPSVNDVTTDGEAVSRE
jgi:uncharacterized small protein (TIGR04563 family)